MHHPNPRLGRTILLCFVANMISFMDRVNISIAAPFIMQAYGWDEARMGIVFSAFFAGYVIFMIPGGVAAERYPTSKVLAGGVALCSAFTVLTPLFSRIASMAACRFAVGAAQGVHFPAINNLIARHVPLAKRARVQAFTLSGVTAGIVIGFPLGSSIIEAWGWPAIFYWFAGVGFVWVLVWMISVKRAAPREPQDPLVRKTIPWKRYLVNRSYLGLSLSYFCHNYSGYLFLVWLPTYLNHVHGISIASLGIMAAMPSLAAGVLMNLSGWLSDHLVKTGRSVAFSRKIMVCLGMGGSGLLLAGLVWADNPYLAVALLTVSAAIRAISTPVYWSLSVDMAPSHAGILGSIMNTFGNIAGVVAAALTGWIVSYFSDWNLAILLGAGVSVAGAALAGVMIRHSAERII